MIIIYHKMFPGLMYYQVKWVEAVLFYQAKNRLGSQCFYYFRFLKDLSNLVVISQLPLTDSFGNNNN